MRQKINSLINVESAANTAVRPGDDSSGAARRQFGSRAALARIERTVRPVTWASRYGGMRLVIHADETIMLPVDAYRKFAL
jgi:hypothetical protein